MYLTFMEQLTSPSHWLRQSVQQNYQVLPKLFTMDAIYFHESFDFVMFDLDFDQKSSYSKYCQPYKNGLLYVF